MEAELLWYGLWMPLQVVLMVVVEPQTAPVAKVPS
jgi:hypothetical protein